MKILLLLMVFGMLRLQGADEGLFIADLNAVPTHDLKNGEIITKWKAERLKLTHAVFRHDSENRKQYWLELDFTKQADPGDFYLFKIDGKDYHGFVLRGEGNNKGGGRWALGFTDAKEGRSLLDKVAKVYELPAKQVEDRTNGIHER
jgi:hypothetical protein